jgi:hypothetical protein
MFWIITGHAATGDHRRQQGTAPARFLHHAVDLGGQHGAERLHRDMALLAQQPGRAERGERTSARIPSRPTTQEIWPTRSVRVVTS